MRVLSLFDGMSCARIALERAGINVTRYYASEVDKYAIKVAQANYPDTVQLGDVRNIMWPETFELEKINLLIGGSPCQGFSFAGKQLNFDDPRSALFWEYVRLLKECKPRYFLLENVRMNQRSQDVITEALGVQPVPINSSLVSAQNRKRLYWTNIPFKYPTDKGILMRDILEDTPQEFTAMSSNFVERNKDSGCLVSEEKDKASNLSAMEYVKNGRQGDYIRCDSNTGKPSLIPTQLKLDLQAQETKIGLRLAGHATNLKGHDYVRRVYHPDGKAPTLCASSGGNLEPKVALNPASITGRRIKDGVRKDSDKTVPVTQCLEVHEGNKTRCLTTVEKDTLLSVLPEGRYADAYNENMRLMWRKLTPIECERLQTVPDNYTAHVSNTQRYKMLGNGFTVDVISEILSGIKR